MAATFSGVPDSHYSVLMIIPIVSAAFRLNLPLTLAVTAVSICLTFLEIWLHYRTNPPTDVTEYFEAATVCLIYLSVAVVVWLLVGNLRAEEQKLGNSLEDLRQLQAKLVMEEKLAAVGQLSSAIAHEIRNPVTMIASSLRLAEGYAPGTPIRNEMFGIAAAESRRLEQLTTDFLAFARVREPEPKQTIACDLLRYIAGLAKARLMEKSQEITIECRKRLEWNLDPTFMEQALLNLVTNAIEATPAGGSIRMGALMEAGDLVFFVENPGPRIDDKVAEHMFEPFFTHGAKGTGLGLSIVRKIANLHSGEVYLADNQEGHVRFEIRLRGEEAVV
jgi:signal transduction histidine kinase